MSVLPLGRDIEPHIRQLRHTLVMLFLGRLWVGENASVQGEQLAYDSWPREVFQEITPNFFRTIPIGVARHLHHSRGNRRHIPNRHQ